jgi:hypothetical protein
MIRVRNVTCFADCVAGLLGRCRDASWPARAPIHGDSVDASLTVSRDTARIAERTLRDLYLIF